MLQVSSSAVQLPSLVSAEGSLRSQQTNRLRRPNHGKGNALDKPRAEASQPALLHRGVSSGAIPLPSVATPKTAASSGVLALPPANAAPCGKESPGGSILGRHWTSEKRRLLHEERERAWLRRQAKHRFIDFSDTERKELKRYFDALATENQTKVGLDKLEDMLISLGLAADRDEVENIVVAVHGELPSEGPRELDFDEFLEIVRTRADFSIFRVFKAMMEGKLGDRNLNFQTVISTYRRQQIMEGTGAGGGQGEQQDRAKRILQNYAALQKSRQKEVIQERTSRSTRQGFDLTGSQAPLGGLVMMWRGVCHEQDLVASRPATSERKAKRALDTPLSPRQVINNIINHGKDGIGNQINHHRGTVFIMSDEINKSLAMGRDLSTDEETSPSLRGMQSPAFNMRIID